MATAWVQLIVLSLAWYGVDGHTLQADCDHFPIRYWKTWTQWPPSKPPNLVCELHEAHSPLILFVLFLLWPRRRLALNSFSATTTHPQKRQFMKTWKSYFNSSRRQQLSTPPQWAKINEHITSIKISQRIKSINTNSFSTQILQHTETYFEVYVPP